MAATSAIASWITPSMQTLNLARTKFLPCSTDHSIKLAPFRAAPTSLSHSFPVEPLAVSHSDRWSIMRRVSTDVAQEEGVDQEGTVDKEDEVSDGDGGDVQREAAQEESKVNTKLYFGNLPFFVDSAQLAGMIQDYGSPELIEVLYDKETGRSRGFAFVTMSSVEDCNAVIENLDGKEFMGRILRVNLANKPKPKDPLYPETEFKLFVGSLSWSVTSESLTEAFRKCGNVVGARVLYDGETGKSRGYGFVSYSTKEEMEKALESLNGMELEGRAIRVSLAQGKRK